MSTYLTEDWTPVEDVIDALRRDGATARVEYGASPTEVEVPLPDGRTVKACRALNREDLGWEAVVETDDGEQTPLTDGPLPGAPAADVAAWVTALIADGLKPA